MILDREAILAVLKEVLMEVLLILITEVVEETPDLVVRVLRALAEIQAEILV